MALAPGTRLGPYEIVAPLGQGGMGEVYRAKDSRLGRDVAVKVLSTHLSSSAEVRARFEREARTVSAFNHPHICTLFDVGREGDTDYLVMELVEGETLATRLERGALPTAEALRIGAQIADALDRAHRAGVVHRDLKPGNIMLTRSGAKLMDFGLARATGLAGTASGSNSMAVLLQSPTVAQPITAEGTIVGTFQYMSPEQLEGKEADARGDIWALGCVLYEMTTGRRAFEGKSQASLIGAIMNSQPAPMSQFAPLSPAALDRLVKQCLNRDPDERWQSAGDVRRELEWISGSSSQSAAPAVRRSRIPAGALGWLAATIVTLAALGYMFGPWRPRDTHVPLLRLNLEAPEGTTLAAPAEMALSPDGSMLAFVVLDSLLNNQIYVRTLAKPEARAVPGTQDGVLPFWSPDGTMLGFFSNVKMRKVALDGSAPVSLCDAPDARGGSWSPDGVILFAPNNQGPIMQVPANGGTPQPATTLNSEQGERGHRYPQFLPDGKHFLYVAIGAGEESSTYAASIEGGAPVEVCKAGSGARWAPPGYLLYLDEGVNSPHRRLLARPFDLDELSATGSAQLLIDPVNADNFGYGNVATDTHGMLVVQHWAERPARLTWKDRHGTVMGVAVDDIQMDGGALSPDATRLAYGGRNPRDVFILDLTSKISTRLTFENKAVTSTIWSPDGTTIAFSRLSTSRGWETHTKAADGTGPDSILFRGEGLFTFPLDWSQDGRWMLALSSDSSGGFDHWRVPMDGSGRPEVYQRTPAEETEGVLSPDGHWVAYVAKEDGKPALYVQSFPNPAAKYQVAVQQPVFAVWTDRGDELLVVTEDNEVQSIKVSTAGGFRQGATQMLFELMPAESVTGITSDGQRFLIGTLKDVSSRSRLEIVVGWPQLLAGSK